MERLLYWQQHRKVCTFIRQSESVSEPRLQYSKWTNIEVLEIEDSSDSSLSSIPSRPWTPRPLREQTDSIAIKSPNRPKPDSREPRVTRVSKHDNRKVSDPAGTSRTTTLAVERKNVLETTFPRQTPSSAEQAQKIDARQVLESIRLFSEQLMQAIACNEEDRLLADVVLDVVNKCDTSSRRLQASIMQSTKRLKSRNSSQLREFDQERL
ncbi:hypothetical protein A7U60_g3212 [Sanghuangporus baumii]|uniref:Uncharacterized protein n=1 Tax=Sanghuangporus baumii TaxID=108892 RepID=A0A9Q5NDB4_SANBA|nr:hypothetical protein A7U60_g3212 [Sanghuangporus baumii]